MPKSETPPPESPQNKSSGEQTPPDGSKKPERRPPSNLFWLLMFIGILAAVLIFWNSPGSRGEKLKYSTFTTKIRNGQYGPQNVFELIVGNGTITFQDQDPDSKTSDADEKTIKYYRVDTANMGNAEQAKLIDLLDVKEIHYELGAMQSPLMAALQILFPMALFLIVVLFLFRRIGGAGTAMSFGRSRGRLYAQEDINITFNDVAGINEAVEELREIVEFLRNPGKYQALGGRIPRGVLLVGPPGTGKTLLAKAVAGEAGVPFLSLSGSDFVEMFVGVGAARVRDMFQQAAQRSPSIIFIDELDALGKTRGSGMPGGHDEREQTLNALLVEMDGFSTEQSVIVMGATNRPETLDPALLRPGRFDRNVLVDRPDIKGREAILKVHVNKIKMDDDVKLSGIAKLSPGFSGADLANLVNEAALLAARNNKKSVTMSEFEDAIDRVVAGLEKHTRIIHAEEKQRVAYHECGHALVACSLPNTDPVHKISIIPRGFGALGYTMQRPEEDRQLVMQSELENRVAVLLGGIAAEEIIYKETSTGAQNDLQRATDIARRMVMEFGMSPKLGRVHYSKTRTSPFLGGGAMPAETAHSEDTMREIDLEVRRIIDAASKTAHDLLNDRCAVLEKMTLELIEVEVMDAEHLKRLLDDHKTSPQIMPGSHATAETEAATESAVDDEDSTGLESAGS